MSTGGSSLLVLGAAELTGTAGPGSSGDATDNCGTNSGFVGIVTIGGAVSRTLAGAIGLGAMACGVVACGTGVFGDSISAVEGVLVRERIGADAFGAAGPAIGLLRL